jgi:hypothetical protein
MQINKINTYLQNKLILQRACAKTSRPDCKKLFMVQLSATVKVCVRTKFQCNSLHPGGISRSYVLIYGTTKIKQSFIQPNFREIKITKHWLDIYRVFLTV